MTIAQLVDDPANSASNTVVTGLCPSLGQGWMFLHPKVDDNYGRSKAAAAKAYASVDEVKAAVTALAAAGAERLAKNPSSKAADHA